MNNCEVLVLEDIRSMNTTRDKKVLLLVASIFMRTGCSYDSSSSSYVCISLLLSFTFTDSCSQHAPFAFEGDQKCSPFARTDWRGETSISNLKETPEEKENKCRTLHENSFKILTKGKRCGLA